MQLAIANIMLNKNTQDAKKGEANQKQQLCNSCNIGTSDLPDMYAQGLQGRGLRAYISDKSRVPMLQLIGNITLWWAEVSSSQKSQNWQHLYIYRKAY